MNRLTKLPLTITAAFSVALVGTLHLPNASAKDFKTFITPSQSNGTNQPAITPSQPVKTVQPPVAVSPTLPTVVSDMNQAINANPDGLTAASSLIDLDNGQEYDSGATDTLFKAASTAKVVTAIDYLHEVEQGSATLTQVIDGTSAQQLIKQMIEASDNQAWADLDNYLGSQQQTYAHSIGLSSFTAGAYNTMTASDMAKLLAELYAGKLINDADQQLLYSYMANTDSTNLIQAALPAGATVYHKYGQLWGYLNDAAIVSYQGHTFVLVVYTNNSDGTTDEYNVQVNLIHSITQVVFQDINAS